MNDYKFRFRKRDWTAVDEEEIAKKIDMMKGKDLSDEEFAAELGMSVDEAMEFMIHHLETKPEYMHAMQFLAGIEALGFDLDEIYYIGNNQPKLSDLLKEHYNGQELGDIKDELSGMSPSEVLDKVMDNPFFASITSGEEKLDPRLEMTLSFFMDAGLTEGQVAHIFMMPEKFVAWVRNHGFFDEPEGEANERG